MKVHIYTKSAYEPDGLCNSDLKLFMPGLGVLTYRVKLYPEDGQSNPIYSLSDAPEVMKEASDANYIKTLDLPDELVNEIINAGRESVKARDKFNEASKSMIDLIDAASRIKPGEWIMSLNDIVIIHDKNLRVLLESAEGSDDEGITIMKIPSSKYFIYACI